MICMICVSNSYYINEKGCKKAASNTSFEEHVSRMTTLSSALLGDKTNKLHFLSIYSKFMPFEPALRIGMTQNVEKMVLTIKVCQDLLNL